jgi:uncharacterized membrane protein
MSDSGPSIDRPRTGLLVTVGVLVVIGIAAVVHRAILVVPSLSAGVPSVDSGARGPAALDDLSARHPLLTLAHILPGAVFLVLAPVQFSARVRARSLTWHRWSGRLLVAAGVVVGVSAFDMGFRMPIGGPIQTAATAVFAAFFLVALAKGVAHARRGEATLHRAWMTRAFATGLAVATIRLIVIAFFATRRLTGLTPREIFGIAFWLGFIANAVAAEILIRRARRDAVIAGSRYGRARRDAGPSPVASRVVAETPPAN